MSVIWKNMKTIELYERCIKDSKTIPPFINTRSEEHHIAFLIISDMIFEVSKLLKKVIMNDKQIKGYILDFEEVASGLDDIGSLTLYMSANNYVNNLVEDYLRESVSDEEYEIATNLRKFIFQRKQYTPYEGSDN